MSQDKIRVFGKIRPGVNYVERPGAYAFILNSQQQLAVVRTSLGLFLPGGGVEAGEDPVAGLKRELLEEIAYELESANFLRQAIQYHWSGYYQKNFKKIGSFYRAEAAPKAGITAHPDHKLVWLDTAQAARQLSQEFQRWAVAEGI
jgi:8-oxo-dGTP diphosphatase